MANRYWVGGSGTWDTSDTTNWSSSSGGAGGASAPTSADGVIFDGNSGSGTCALGSNVECESINLTNYTGTVDFSTFKIGVAGSGTTIVNLGATASFTGLKRIELTDNATTGARTITGNLSSSPGGQEVNAPDVYVLSGTDTISGGIHCRDLNFTGFSGSHIAQFTAVYGDLVMSPTMTTANDDRPLQFGATTERNITTNGVVFEYQLRFIDSGTWVLQDDLTIASDYRIRLEAGTLNANNKNVTLGGFLTATTQTKSIVMGDGSWTLTGDDAAFTNVWNANFGATGFSVVPGSGTINMTSANKKTFDGANQSYGTLNQGGSGELEIRQSNTFANITNTVQPATISFAAGTVTTFNDINIGGASGNLVSLNCSSAGTRATINRPSGLTELSFVNIRDINATGQAFFSYLFEGNVDSGNNAGIRFNLPDSSTVPAMFI